MNIAEIAIQSLLKSVDFNKLLATPEAQTVIGSVKHISQEFDAMKKRQLEILDRLARIEACIRNGAFEHFDTLAGPDNSVAVEHAEAETIK